MVVFSRYGHYVEGTGSVLQTSSIEVSVDIGSCDPQHAVRQTQYVSVFPRLVERDI
jgi:hypothetical protein